MDLSLSFSSPGRRASFPDFKTKCDSNLLPIHLPIESDSSNSMFESPGGCRVTPWVLPNYSSNCSCLHKSFQFNKSHTSQKTMVPKIPSLALSFSQQTIVGGFVGSKTHAGRSFFGESYQIWDSLMCKFVQLMSLAKEKTTDRIADSKATLSNVNNSKMFDSSVSSTSSTTTTVTMENEILFDCVADNNYCDSSSKISNPSASGIENLDAGEISKPNPTCALQKVCDPVKSLKNERTILSIYQKETYSAVVDRSCKKKTQCIQPVSCTASKSPALEQSTENCKVILPSPQKQTYADVAKSIPHKSLNSQKNVRCEVLQNFKKRILHCKSNRDKREYRGSPSKKATKHVNTSKSPVMDDVMANGDTRWRADWKLKRAKLQKSHPVTVPSRLDSSIKSETMGKNVIEETCAENLRTESESVSSSGSEAGKTEFLTGMRGRHPSECSIDSDDSFVVFEDCPDLAANSLPHSSAEQNSSLEVDEFADDESITSNDDSDSEDVSMDVGGSWYCSPVSSSKLHKANYKWGSGFSAYMTPKSESKVLHKKKVHFVEGCQLAVVRPMIAWGYAYRESRRGPWEIYARDRARFHCRIESLAPILNAILDPKHRKRILESRFSDS